MADKKTRKLSPKQLQDDIAALDALAAISDYTPSNPAYTQANAVTNQHGNENERSQSRAGRCAGKSQPRRDGNETMGKTRICAGNENADRSAIRFEFRRAASGRTQEKKRI